MDKLPGKIERLTEEPVSGARVRARLAATFAEALGQSAGSRPPAPEDIAQAAAFIDGRLQGHEREAFLASLSRDAGRRADLESAAALVESVEPNPIVPPHLSTWAMQELG